MVAKAGTADGGCQAAADEDAFGVNAVGQPDKNRRGDNITEESRHR
jgi:hypothetical protein